MSNLLKDNKDLMKEYNFEKNKSFDLDTLTIGSGKKIWWICPKCHSSYECTIPKRNKGLGCPYCSGHRVLKGYNDLATTRPDLLIEWNFSKNTIKPDEVSKGSNQKVWWKCKDCNYEWESSINNRGIANHGCPKCGRKKLEDALRKRVQQISLDGKLIAEYSSVAEAIRKTGIVNIYSACKGKYKSAGGYFWKYKDNK